jgi:F0F1-type ATP synthase delta subunit
MGLFDIFGGGTKAERAQRLKSKATQKYGDPATRQKALQQLSELQSADAVPVLMQRFTFNVDPQTTDADEKNSVFEAVCELKQDCVKPVSEFLTKSDAASSWALKILEAVLPEAEVTGIVVTELRRLGTEYTRDPEKKEVLLQHLQGKTDDRIGEVLVPFLHDMSDDVKMTALRTVASVKYEPAREGVLQLLTGVETAKRVQTACVVTLAETGFTVQGYREKVEARLPEGYSVDKSGAVKKRGS